ncbi:MAG: hypothetical protein SGBAC_001389 [Bacillariaceae sp.]
MNRPRPSSMTSPLAMKPMEIKSSVVDRNVINGIENHDRQPSTPRVNFRSLAMAAQATTATTTTTNATTRTVTGAEESPENGRKLDETLSQAGNIQSLVFSTEDIRHDLGPPDENHVPSPSTLSGNKRMVTGEIPVFEISSLHAFRSDEMPVYWRITNLKPSKVTRHLRCLLLALEARPTFFQIRPQYYQLRDHFLYSYGSLHIHSTAPHHEVKLQALYQSIFDKLHGLLSLADQLEADQLEGSDEDTSVADDENRSEQSDVSKRRRTE